MLKIKNLTRFFLPTLCCFFFFTLASAQNIPERPNPPRLVNDFANILSASERQELEKKLQTYNDTTSTQIAIVTIKSTGDYPISDVAIKILRTWGVGSKKNNNGIVILAAIEDKKVRIETGYGMEAILSDGLCGSIIREVIRPYFKKGDYYNGLSAASDEIIKAARGEYQDHAEQNPNQGGGGEVIFLLIFLLFIFFILYRSNRGGGGMMVSRRGYHPWGGGTWINTGGGGWHDDDDRRGGGGGWSGGGFDFGGGDGGGGGADGGW